MLSVVDEIFSIDLIKGIQLNVLLSKWICACNNRKGITIIQGEGNLIRNSYLRMQKIIHSVLTLHTLSNLIFVPRFHQYMQRAFRILYTEAIKKGCHCVHLYAFLNLVFTFILLKSLD